MPCGWEGWRVAWEREEGLLGGAVQTRPPADCPCCDLAGGQQGQDWSRVGLTSGLGKVTARPISHLWAGGNNTHLQRVAPLS